jgi:cbb3-type cytochrome oxidase maturation protein
MPGLLIMLPLAVLIALGFLILFFWSVKNGDYNDPEMPGHRMVLDEQDDVDTSIQKKSFNREGRA